MVNNSLYVPKWKQDVDFCIFQMRRLCDYALMVLAGELELSVDEWDVHGAILSWAKKSVFYGGIRALEYVIDNTRYFKDGVPFLEGSQVMGDMVAYLNELKHPGERKVEPPRGISRVAKYAVSAKVIPPSEEPEISEYEGYFAITKKLASEGRAESDLDKLRQAKYYCGAAIDVAPDAKQREVLNRAKLAIDKKIRELAWPDGYTPVGASTINYESKLPGWNGNSRVKA